MNRNLYIFILSLCCLHVGFSQSLLTKNKAISLALTNNYGIKIANNNSKIAENNTSVYNTGYLPTVNANGNFTYFNKNNKTTFQNNTTTTNNGAENKNYSAAITANYLLFDGFGRSYNYKKLQENYNLSKIEAKEIIENTLLNVFSVYFEVARLTENLNSSKELLQISNQRLKRVNYAFEYGQVTKLNVLNAEVDVNNDSIRYLNTKKILTNTKRELNLLLGRDVQTIFNVETEVTLYKVYNLRDLLNKAKEKNVEAQKIESYAKINTLNQKINTSKYFPSLYLFGGYNATKVVNDNSYNLAKQNTNGLNTGIRLNWNIFDGGKTKINHQNIKIAANNLQIQKEQLLSQIEKQVSNALETYNNAITILKAEEKNVTVTKVNFERTNEQFKLGRITSIEFRQAQLNLLNAKVNLNASKYNAKNAELFLLKLTGELLNTLP